MASVWKHIVDNSLLLLLGRTVSKVATILVMVVAGRLLSVPQFGEFNTLLAITALCGLFADFGLVLPTIRSISYRDGHEMEIVAQTLSAKLSWGLCVIVGVFFFSFFTNLPPLTLLVFTISSVLETSAFSIVRSFEGRQEMKVVTLYMVVERFVFCALVLMSLWQYRTLAALGVSYLVSNILMLCFAIWLFQRRFGAFRFELSYRLFVEYTRIGFPFFLTVMFSALYYKIDTVLLSFFRNNTEVGVYNAAMRIVEAQMFIPMTMMASIFPVLARLYFEKDDSFLRVFRKSLLSFIVIGLVVGGAVFAFAPAIVRILFSDTYESSITPLRILSIMLVFYFLNFLLSQTLIAINQERVFTIIVIVCSLMSIICNTLVIPRFGFVGASWVRVSVELFSSALFGLFLFLGVRKKNEHDAAPNIFPNGRWAEFLFNNTSR